MPTAGKSHRKKGGADDDGACPISLKSKAEIEQEEKATGRKGQLLFKICPVRQPDCKDENFYNADDLAQYVFGCKQTTYPHTRETIPKKHLQRLVAMRPHIALTPAIADRVFPGWNRSQTHAEFLQTDTGRAFVSYIRFNPRMVGPDRPTSFVVVIATSEHMDVMDIQILNVTGFMRFQSGKVHLFAMKMWADGRNPQVLIIPQDQAGREVQLARVVVSRETAVGQAIFMNDDVANTWTPFPTVQGGQSSRRQTKRR